MHIYGATFQEHCFNTSGDIVYSAFQKEKRHSSVFWKVFQISRNYFSLHMHFNPNLIQNTNPNTKL